MEHLYNKIRPVGNRVIVAVKKGSKNTHTIKGKDGEDIELYVDTSFSWDGKITNHTQGVLLTDFKNLKAGTDVLLYHNATNDTNELDIYIDATTYIYSIESDNLYFGLDGENLICLDGFMLAERMYDEDELSDGGIILTEKKKKDSVLKILAKPDSVDDYEVGDIAVVFKYSDYEMVHTIGGKQTRIIRLKYTDCIGKVNVEE